MKKNNHLIEMYRTEDGGDPSFENNGKFLVPRSENKLLIIASDGMGWDHVSVSVLDAKRCPTWEEMCFVKDLFFESEETVIQYHPPKSQYVNHHPYCLHLWRHQTIESPLPNSILVGPKTRNVAYA